MSRETDLLVHDILSACDKIVAWTDDLSAEAFAERGIEYSAVLRELTVIGEAVKQLPEDLRIEVGALPWREIAGLRDVLVHHYFGISDETVWMIARNDVPELSGALRLWLQRGGGSLE